ncbi:MAG: DUF488 family protein [Thermoanaerobaculia bacterium]
MTVRIVKLGTTRRRGEGPRLGTVRRPPRGVARDRYAEENYFDAWLPLLAPSEKLLAAARSGRQADGVFERRYRAEMQRPDARRLLDALAVLSLSANFSVGCYCDDEERCHRRILRALLEERGARVR